MSPSGLLACGLNCPLLLAISHGPHQPTFLSFLSLPEEWPPLSCREKDGHCTGSSTEHVHFQANHMLGLAPRATEHKL